jgi:hypothetical protein
MLVYSLWKSPTADGLQDYLLTLSGNVTVPFHTVTVSQFVNASNLPAKPSYGVFIHILVGAAVTLF